MEFLNQAETLLDKMESFFLSRSSEPISNYAYNLIMDSYAQTSGVENRSQRIRNMMKRMEHLAKIHANPLLLPDKFSYSSLIRAIREEAKPGFNIEIQNVIQAMKESAQPSMQPDLNIYALALDSLSKSNDEGAQQQATQLLDDMKKQPDIQLDDVIYTIMMKIHSNAGDAEKSDDTLASMLDEYRGGNNDCRPGERAYRTAIKSWTRTGGSKAFGRAMRLFEDMIKKFEEGNTRCRPTNDTFYELLRILAQSQEPSKYQIGHALLSGMKKFDLRPSKHVLNMFLNVCASDTGVATRKRAFISCLEIFQDLQTTVDGADSFAVHCMLRACENLLDDAEERENMASKLYLKFGTDHRVNPNILRILCNCVSTTQFISLTGMRADQICDEALLDSTANAPEKCN